MSFPTKVASLIYKVEVQYDANDNPIYVGVAKPGTLTSENSWRIAKITYSGNNPIEITFANGDLEFNEAWDNRLALSYS